MNLFSVLPRSLALLLFMVVPTFSGVDSGLMTSTERQGLIQLLLKARVLRQGRVLVHLSQTCNLIIQGASYTILDARELIPGASFAHGYNQVVVLDESLRLQQAFQYIDQRPLFCSGNELYVSGELAVNGVDPGGNVLVFKRPKEPPTYRTVSFNTIRNAPVQ